MTVRSVYKTMFHRLFQLTFFLLITFLFEILFVRYLPGISDVNNTSIFSDTKFHNKVSSDFTFPTDRRKTAPEIRKHVYNTIKKESSITFFGFLHVGG